VRDFSRRTTSLVYVIDGGEDAAAGPMRFAEVPEVDEVIVAASHRPLGALPARGDWCWPARRRRSATCGSACKGHRILLVAQRHTFAARCIKLLVYRDADMVVGTRTTRQMIEQGANMRGIARAHISLAKLLYCTVAA
jgi:hypothetical protein